jgi:hypothetical protein
MAKATSALLRSDFASITGRATRRATTLADCIVPSDEEPSHDRAAGRHDRSSTLRKVASMRDRHFPRLCRACRSPMARQEDTCWHCGTLWASEDAPPTRLRVLAGGAPGAHPDADRWLNDGGSFEPEAPAIARAVAGTG